MPVEIPKSWRQTVAALLRNGATGRQVMLRQRARRDWADLFPDQFDYQLRDAFADALEHQVTTGRRYDMDEPGETYGFIFCHAGKSIYGKLNLTEQNQVVIIYSAHRPLHGEQFA